MNTDQKPGRGRPKGEKPAREVKSFTLDMNLFERLKAFSSSSGFSSSEIINQALSEYLEKERA